jgi:hypothetical protein
MVCRNSDTTIMARLAFLALRVTTYRDEAISGRGSE